jgi:alpha-galactosidase
VEGSTYIYQNTWTSVNGQPIDIDGGRAMDPTHPGTRERIIKYINFFKSLGFKMIKIDFLGHATLEADHYYDDRIKTGMEAFRSGMEFLDSLLDNKMLVYAAISPNLATARYVHMRRIACDAFKSISETAYTLNSVTYGWWQGHIYDYIDADHVVFKGASPGENRARLASAVVTGSLITGDDYSAKGSWRQVAQHLLQNKGLLGIVDTDGKPFRPCSVEVGQDPSNFFEKRVGNKIFLAVFNYGNNASSFWVSYAKLGITKLRSIEKIMGPDLVEAREEGGKIAVKLPMKDAIILQLNL